MAYYQEIRYCIVSQPTLLNDGICNNFDKYNTAGCKFDGGDCLDFNKNYTGCQAPYPFLLADGKCDGPEYNTPECDYDGGDCLDFNVQYPDCNVTNPNLIGNGICDSEESELYNTTECGFDGSDCLDFWGKYPDCKVDDISLVGNGRCNDMYNTAACNYDNGDCIKENLFAEFMETHPDCDLMIERIFEDGFCHSEVNTLECSFDNGECDAFNLKYPNCVVVSSGYIGDDVCDGGEYNTEECGFDGGDCLEHNAFLEKYPNCEADQPFILGDGKCDHGLYNTPECDYDRGDCIEFNSKYPNCKVDDPLKLGDDRCDGGMYNTIGCAYDGGDCLEYDEFILKHPNCDVDDPSKLGDGICDQKYNTTECRHDNGDCVDFFMRFPDCVTTWPSWIRDGYCDGMHNSFECGFDGGDCDVFNERYPDCKVDDPWWIDDGTCTFRYNTPECKFDGGDCERLNNFLDKHVQCKVDEDEDLDARIGDDICDSKYNTPECDWDDGDCALLNSKFPNCPVNMNELGDGICQHNSPGCLYDDGDCDFYNKLYPDCTADKPQLIGNGYCNEEYDTVECKNDGGDCMRNGTAGVLFVDGAVVSVEKYRQNTRTYSIIQIITSIISLLASIGIIWIIRRSYINMSIPFHRLLLGMCVSDICSSFAQAFSTLPAPDSTDIIWNAQGNIGSCRAQGFFIFAGSIAAPLYNCSLCIYYYLVITFKKGKDAQKYVEGKIEFFLHAIPIGISLMGATIILSMDAFHPNMTYCFIGANPTCDDLDCDERNRHVNVLFMVFSAGPYIILPCVIIVTMSLMYRAVLAQEKKLQQYGAKSIRLRMAARNSTQPTSGLSAPSNLSGPSGGTEQQSNRSMSGLLVRLKTMTSKSSFMQSIRNIKNPANKAGWQVRAIMHRAFAYSLAFFLTYLFPIIISIRTLNGTESGAVLSILARIFFPLQGFFNFVVYIYPKVTQLKKVSRPSITWYEAFVKALKSRGKRKMNRSSRIHQSFNLSAFLWKMRRKSKKIFRFKRIKLLKQKKLSNDHDIEEQTLKRSDFIETPLRPMPSASKSVLRKSPQKSISVPSGKNYAANFGVQNVGSPFSESNDVKSNRRMAGKSVRFPMDASPSLDGAVPYQSIKETVMAAKGGDGVEDSADDDERYRGTAGKSVRFTKDDSPSLEAFPYQSIKETVVAAKGGDGVEDSADDDERDRGTAGKSVRFSKDASPSLEAFPNQSIKEMVMSAKEGDGVEDSAGDDENSRGTAGKSVRFSKDASPSLEAFPNQSIKETVMAAEEVEVVEDSAGDDDNSRGTADKCQEE